MGRKNKHTKKELKALILEETWNIIKNESFHSLSTRKIAKKIGYTVGTIYNVFNNFDELILEINAKTLQLLYKSLQIEPNNQENPVSTVLKLANNYFDFSRKYFPFWKILFEYNALTIPQYPDWYQTKIDYIFNQVEKTLSPSLGIDRQLDVKAIWAGIHGICVLVLNDKLKISKSITPEILAKSLFENYFAGIIVNKKTE